MIANAIGFENGSCSHGGPRFDRFTPVRRAVSSLAVLAGCAALLAGCGGGGGSSTTSAADWASGYCGAATSWVTTLDQARAGFRTGATTLGDAVGQVTDETDTFLQSIGGLGVPDTPDGSTSDASATDLSKRLSGRNARISGTISTTNPDVTPAQQTKIVQSQVAANLTDVKDTTAKLAADDAELGTAMGAATECTDLTAALQKSAA